MDWYIPIAILPGVAMIIFSTSRLWISLSEEIERIERNLSLHDESLVFKKLHQLNRLNFALILQYGSAFFFVAASVIGGIIDWYQPDGGSHTSTLVIMFLGALLLSIALLFLVIYSFGAVKIRKEQFEIEDLKQQEKSK